MIRVRDNNLEAARQVDRATQALVPDFAPGTLPTDPKHLDTLFAFCTCNWRTYQGEKPTAEKLARINAVHKQATLGDCTDTEWSTPFEKTVLTIWRSYKGTPALMAKRRFLALLRNVDARLLQIKAYHFAPWGFPTTGKGERICPYSNTKKGCPRPLMDKYGHILEHELDNNESLADFVNLKKWLDEVAAQQRCALGLHTPITAHMGARFASFFSRPECGGFLPYTSTGLHKMVKKVLTKQLQALVEMQNNPRDFSRSAQVLQRDRFMGLQQYYTSLTGCEFTNEVSCSRDSHHCNTRRLAEEGNHTHPVVIRPPTTDLTLYDALNQVRRECIRLGVVPMTGMVHSIDHRCRLLRMKIVDFHRKKMLVYESQRRQQWRTDIAANDAAMLKAFSQYHRSSYLRDALGAKNMERICLAVESGADPSTEIRGGLFPVMAAVFKRSIPDVQRLLAAGADVDLGNSRGMTALMWAVKRDDFAMVHALLDEGADVGVEGCTGWTAMSVASRHGRRDIAQLLVETILRDKVAGEMNADRVLNHRSMMNAGLTPVAIAAIHRNEAMVRYLMRLGAKPGVKCQHGYVAGEHAAKAGWTILGLWMQETQAFGANGVYTFADINAENTLRIAGTRMLDAISSGATVEDKANKVVQKQTSSGIPEAEQSKNVPEPLDESLHHHGQLGLFDVSTLQLGKLRSNTVLTVMVLQEGHAAPDTETDSGHTALISAAYRGLFHSVRLLIQEGADPNYSNRNDRTALMAAATAGHHKTVVTLLQHGANAASLDIDGKSAGAFAFERGFGDLVELLAISSSKGNSAALEWELERGRREVEGKQHQRTEDLLEKGGGRGIGVHEADLHDWMIRVTKPREAARLAETSKSLHESTDSLDVDGDIKGRTGKISPPRQEQSHGNRCPKCTLFVPCLHFASLESLRAMFPDGVPEWRWNKTGATRRINPGRGSTLNNAQNRTGGASGGETDVVWWRVLHQARRNRMLGPAKMAGGGPEPTYSSNSND